VFRTRRAAARRPRCEDASVTGRLVLAATPIGNVDDASPRLRAALAAADVIAAEDTRRLRRLLAALDVVASGRVVSYHEHNEGARTAELVVVLVTDAGMPSISDPGYRLVAEAVAAGVGVTALPGPSALTMALALSGLPVDRFCFEGFLPRKRGQRRGRLMALSSESRTMVFYEAPHRIADVLADVGEAFGFDRPAAVARELTKTYEEVRRGSVRELFDWAAPGVRGELTLIVAGRPDRVEDLDDHELAARVADAMATGSSRKDAIAAVANATGTPRRRVYDAAHNPRGADEARP
jgi:16S rRNA (cytidine1402-2'-O)-methyltransferase